MHRDGQYRAMDRKRQGEEEGEQILRQTVSQTFKSGERQKKRKMTVMGIR